MPDPRRRTIKMVEEFTDDGNLNTYSIFDFGRYVEVDAVLLNFDKDENNILYGVDDDNLIKRPEELMKIPDLYPKWFQPRARGKNNQRTFSNLF